MSNTVDNAFIKDYNSDVHAVFQRNGGFLRNTVRTKDNIVGKSTTFQKVGKGTATTKARHGVVTPMNQSHTPIECTLEDFYAGDWVDRLDEAKTNIDERMAIAEGGSWALGRKVDDQILTQMALTTATTLTFTVTSLVAVRNSLISIVEAMDAADLPDDGNRYVLLTPRAWSQAEVVEQFSSADYVKAGEQSFASGAKTFGRWKSWRGAMWGHHTGLPGVTTASAKCFAWHKNGVGFATGAHAGNVAGNQAVSADITWHGDRAAHFVNHMMSGGACLIDDTGVIDIDIDDTTAVVTT